MVREACQVSPGNPGKTLSGFYAARQAPCPPEKFSAPERSCVVAKRFPRRQSPIVKRVRVVICLLPWYHHPASLTARRRLGLGIHFAELQAEPG